MTLNPDIRDQAYQFFIQEAPELLQVLETGLLALNQQRSPSQVHNLMRAAHSLKGGASSVGLDAIATIAHRLEHILKALYSDSLEIDIDLENRLLQAYDCLRIPLLEQINQGYFQPEQALAAAEPIFAQIETQLGEELIQAENYIPSSKDLGVNMVVSIMEVDVAEGLARLQAVLEHPDRYEVMGELRAQVEVFAGFAELLNLPEFGAIAEVAQYALDAHPHQALEITQLALRDFEYCRQQVLAGSTQPMRTASLPISGPSAELIALANRVSLDASDTATLTSASAIEIEDPAASLPSLAEVFGSTFLSFDNEFAEHEFAEHEFAEHEFANESEHELIDPLGHTLDREDESDREDELSTISFLQESSPVQEWGDQQSAEPLIAAWQEVDLVDLAATLADIEPDYIVVQPIDADLTNTDLSDRTGLTQPSLDFDTAEIAEPDIKATEPEARAANVAEAEASADVVSQSDPDHSDDLEDLEDLDRPDPLDEAEPITAVSSGSPAGLVPSQIYPVRVAQVQPAELAPVTHLHPHTETARLRQPETPIASNLTVRVDSERLEQMNNLVGELAINRDGLSLQNEQLQGALRILLNRFARFQTTVDRLRTVSDQMLTAPERQSREVGVSSSDRQEFRATAASAYALPDLTASNLNSSLISPRFDPLEMDSYGALHSELQGILEEMVQMEETVNDVTLFAKQSDEKLNQQRLMLAELRDELIWVRMLPLGEVLHRFPRVIRDLSMTYQKPVNLTLIGTDVLVDKAVLEKLYDPLLHLLRNAFDHGIEPAYLRRQQGKPEQGEIEIRAYHRANQTIIEVKDDGQGINFDRIRHRLLELGWMSPEQVALTPPKQLLELIFEPGFSTARQVNELSGRGIGLDVVRSQLQAVKGSVTVTSTPHHGTLFSLSLPLTLTISKLVIILAETNAFAISAESIEEILTPHVSQTRQSGGQRFLYWQEQIIPVYRLAHLMEYRCPLTQTPAKTLTAVPTPDDWALPMLIIRSGQQIYALEVDRLITEQELVIKPLSPAIAPPSYVFGCTILGDGSLIPVIDGIALIELALRQESISANGVLSVKASQRPGQQPPVVTKTPQTTTVLVVDDAVTLRRTLALSLERAGFRVLQARDGEEAIEQLQQSLVQVIICDIEMPNMNGFEFLNYRRQDAQISAIPVVMLTSRSNDKHRWLAMQLGATTYLTKPYLEQDLLATLEKILN